MREVITGWNLTQCNIYHCKWRFAIPASLLRGEIHFRGYKKEFTNFSLRILSSPDWIAETVQIHCHRRNIARRLVKAKSSHPQRVDCLFNLGSAGVSPALVKSLVHEDRFTEGSARFLMRCSFCARSSNLTPACRSFPSRVVLIWLCSV